MRFTKEAQVQLVTIFDSENRSVLAAYSDFSHLYL